MSALTDKIVTEHRYTWANAECSCDKGRRVWMEDYAEHIATVTEAAVREQVARDIKAWIAEQAADGVLRTGAWSDGVSYGAYAAADVAHGGAA